MISSFIFLFSQERGNLPAVSALLQNNADFDVVDGDGNNALHIAVRESHLSVVRELLTESRVNAEAINLKGRNPLHELCRSGKDNVAAAILELFLECTHLSFIRSYSIFYYSSLL